MRHAILAILIVVAGGAAMTAAPGPVAAYDFPYCIQGSGWGVPGDCSYRSYAECMTTASGRDVYCNINPRFAFSQQRRGRSYRNYNDY